VHFSELVWAALTVGKWRDDLNTRGIYSLYEGSYRTNLVRAFLREDGGEFVRTDAYNDLDPTEKGYVSYHLGIIAAKVLASRLLSVPWLMHIDRYKNAYGVALRSGGSRPDLFGPRHLRAMSNWLVLEAKGRTNNLKGDDAAKVRAQKRQVVTVGGRDPWIRGGVVAHFSSGVLGALFVDPRPRRREHRREAFKDFHPEVGVFLRTYYAPLLALFEDDSRDRIVFRRNELPLRIVPEADIAVGLTNEAMPGLHGELPPRRRFRVLREPQLAIAGDGAIVRLGESWAPEQMTLEPGERISHEISAE
jgi:hypothetical protein